MRVRVPTARPPIPDVAADARKARHIYCVASLAWQILKPNISPRCPMITVRLLTVLAASSLAGIAYAQTQPVPSNQPSAAPGYKTSNPHQREIKSVPGNESASPNARSAPGSGLNTAQTGRQASPESKTAPGAALNTPASSQRNRAESLRMAEVGPGAGGHGWSSMPVESSSGQSLGSVVNVVPGLNGTKSSGYVVVSGSNGMSIPVPYRTADAMVRDGKLILSQSRFEHAPRVSQEDLQNHADHAWRIKADRYWMRKGHRHLRK